MASTTLQKSDMARTVSQGDFMLQQTILIPGRHYRNKVEYIVWVPCSRAMFHVICFHHYFDSRSDNVQVMYYNIFSVNQRTSLLHESASRIITFGIHNQSDGCIRNLCLCRISHNQRNQHRTG